jgi:hypothetical protein
LAFKQLCLPGENFDSMEQFQGCLYSFVDIKRVWNLKQKSLTKAGERATSAEDCRHVSVGVSVQQYSVQCKVYNLIGVTTLEASETRGTTALVYCLISSSLYTGTVQGWWSTPQLV